MNYEQILEQAKRNKGIKFNQKAFRVAFDQPLTGDMKLLNRLVKEGIVSKIGPGKYIIN